MNRHLLPPGIPSVCRSVPHSLHTLLECSNRVRKSSECCSTISMHPSRSRTPTTQHNQNLDARQARIQLHLLCHKHTHFFSRTSPRNRTLSKRFGSSCAASTPARYGMSTREVYSFAAAPPGFEPEQREPKSLVLPITLRGMELSFDQLGSASAPTCIEGSAQCHLWNLPSEDNVLPTGIEPVFSRLRNECMGQRMLR